MINIAIVGIGNCASSLYQGIEYYKKYKKVEGLLRDKIGKYTLEHINIVAAFDIDDRKVGRPLSVAIKSQPNCTPIYFSDLREGPIVEMGHVIDGVADNMASHFIISNESPTNISSILIDRKVDILINYLPVGSEKATAFYANECIKAKTSLLNCIPVFIASNTEWEQKFIDAGIPLIGDDMKSQFGASILSQMLQELAASRGIHVQNHIQRNIGGNTDFLNMTNQSRLKSKKISKENVIRDKAANNTFVHAGPSEYIECLEDNKIADIHLDMKGFLGSPITLDAKLSVVDSPNSAGVVCDAIRYLAIARDKGISGSIRGPSAFTQKTPPENMSHADSITACNKLIQ